MNYDEKRRCYRIDIILPARIHFAALRKASSKAEIQNISAIGLCLTTKEKIIGGQDLEVRVLLPTQQRVILHGTVMWIKTRCLYEHYEHRLGLKLKDRLTEDEAEFVKFYAQELIKFFEKKKQEERGQKRRRRIRWLKNRGRSKKSK